MKVLYRIKKGFASLLLPFLLLNSTVFAMDQEYVKPIESINVPDFECNIWQDANSSRATLIFSEAGQPPREITLEGQEYVQFAQECQRSCPTPKLPQDAVFYVIANAIHDAKQGNVKALAILMNLKQKTIDGVLFDRKKHAIGIPVELPDREQVPVFSAASAAATSSAASAAAPISFARDARIENTRMLAQQFAEQHPKLQIIASLRNDDVSKQRLTEGVKRFIAQAVEFIQPTHEKQRYDFLLPQCTFYGDRPLGAELCVENLFGSLRLAIINAYTKIDRGIIHFGNSSGNIGQIIASLLYQHAQLCAPEIASTMLENYTNKNIPGFSDVKAELEEGITDWVLGIPGKLINKWTEACSISCGTHIVNDRNFQHFIYVYSLCKNGDFKKAKSISYPHSPTEQELIRIYQPRVPIRKPSVLEGGRPKVVSSAASSAAPSIMASEGKAVSVTQQLTSSHTDKSVQTAEKSPSSAASNEASSAVSSDTASAASSTVSDETEMSVVLDEASSASLSVTETSIVKPAEQLFQVSTYAGDIIQAYGKDIKEITDFEPKSFQQFTAHAYLVDCINKQADRVHTSTDVTEQAIVMYTIDGLIKAYGFNKNNQLEDVGRFLTKYGKKAADVTAHFITTFLSNLTHNASHPLEHIQECVQAVGKLFVGSAKLGYFIVDASIGQLFRTPEERAVYFDELKAGISFAYDQLHSLTAKDVAGIAANIMADMIFDSGLGYVARLGKGLGKIPRLVAKVAEEAEKGDVGKVTSKEGASVQKAIKGVAGEVADETLAAAKPLDYAHSAVQYERLKEALRAEEFTSIVKVTKHGLERLIERGFEPEEVISLLTKPDYVRIQSDGAKALIKSIGDNKYNFIVINEKTEEIITVLRKIDRMALVNQGRNYGWKL
ncbi:MAG: DUF4258 domain-containing protein [bacterium]|nr:DUF4258 domain-containing protein [bacterium]